MLPSVSTFIHTVYLFGKIPVQPFGVLVGLAIVLGYVVSRRRAANLGLNPDLCADGNVWSMVVGFIVAHLVSVVFYFPERVLESVFNLYAFWAGLSSFGGLVGAFAGCIVFYNKKWGPMVAWLDPLVFGLVPALIFHLIKFDGWLALGSWVGLMVAAYLLFQKSGFSPLRYIGANVLPWLLKLPHPDKAPFRAPTAYAPYSDAMIYGFVPAWILGRMGCTIVFDHPGLPLTHPSVGLPSVVAMAARVRTVWQRTPKGLFRMGLRPGWSAKASWWEIGVVMLLSHHKEGLVHNLGLYEMLFAVLLTVVLIVLKRVRPFDGFHPTLVLYLYSPVRFVLDYLRIQDAKYLGLTPGQYFSLLGLVGAVLLTFWGMKQRQAKAAMAGGEAEDPAEDPAEKPADKPADKPAGKPPAARRKKRKKKK